MKLHDYQIVARDWIQNRKQSVLLLDMGLGKTASTLCALTDEHFPVLVVAPKRVAETVWPTEARKWRPDLSVIVAQGTKDQRMRALISKKQVIVIGRDNLRDVLDAPRQVPFKTLVLDELSGFKNRQSVRWKTARKIINENGIRHRIGLTGTPAPNGLMDLWAQMALIDDGKRLGRSLSVFREQYFKAGYTMANGVVTEWILREGAAEKIHDLLDDLCLSMGTEGRIHLPPMTINELGIDLPPAIRRVYKQMKTELVADLEMLGGEVHTAVNAAALSNKLSQITAGFLYVDDADIRGRAFTPLHTEKVKAVQEIVEGTGSPLLLLYRYIPEMEMLKKTFGSEAHTIDEPEVMERWDEGQIPILLAHPASAGHGLNLQYGGHTAVWTSLTWDLELYQQANKRLARQGQTKPVVIHQVMARKTIDYHIPGVLEGKDTIQSALRDHLESPL